MYVYDVSPNVAARSVASGDAECVATDPAWPVAAADSAASCPSPGPCCVAASEAWRHPELPAVRGRTRPQPGVRGSQRRTCAAPGNRLHQGIHPPDGVLVLVSVWVHFLTDLQGCEI